MRKQKRQSLPPPDWQQAGLTIGQYTFCLGYLENGFNASAAYRSAYPSANEMTARVEGNKHLTKPAIRAFLNPKLEAIWKPMQMGGEEALARIARIATFDIRRLFNERDELLPVKDWPDDVAGVVTSIQDGPYGRKLTIEKPHAALRTILEQTGKLKGRENSIDALAEALRADYERHSDIP